MENHSPYGPVSRCAVEPPPEAPAERQYIVRMSLQYADALPRVRVPHADAVVTAAAEQPEPAVRSVRTRLLGVHTVTLLRTTVRLVRPLVRTVQNVRLIWSERGGRLLLDVRKGQDGAGVPVQAGLVLAGVEVPDLKSAKSEELSYSINLWTRKSRPTSSLIRHDVIVELAERPPRTAEFSLQLFPGVRQTLCFDQNSDGGSLPAPILLYRLLRRAARAFGWQQKCDR